MNRLKATSTDEQFFTSAISVLGPKPGQELPAPSSDFNLSVTPDGELRATIEMPVPVVDIVAIVNSVKLIVDRGAGPNNDRYVRKALSLLSETRCPEPKVRLNFPDGTLYMGNVYAAATGEELYGCITGFGLTTGSLNPNYALDECVFLVVLEMYVASLDEVLDGLDPDVFGIKRDDRGATLFIRRAAAKQNSRSPVDTSH